MLSPPAFFVSSKLLDSGILNVLIANPINPILPTQIAPIRSEDLNIETIKYIKYPIPPPNSRVY